MNQIKKSISIWAKALIALTAMIGTSVSQAQTPPQDILEISAGSSHTCAITKQKVHCFGNNTYGQSIIVREFKNPRGITSGNGHSCLIDIDGVWCWGNDDNGQSTVPQDL